jgi:predicted nucleic acid-binding protein
MMVVANASPLIHLSAIQRLEVLRALFVEVLIPCKVYNEVVMRALVVPALKKSLLPIGFMCALLKMRSLLECFKLAV